MRQFLLGLLRAADADFYARTLTMPWGRFENRILIATAEPGPETVLFARQRWGTALEFVVASKFDIVWSVQTAFADTLSHRAVYDLAEHDPEMSARQVMTPVQTLIGYGLFSALLGGLAFAPANTLIALNVDTRDAVDATLARTTQAGGKADPNPAQDHGFMVSRSVEDPDGNVWEIVWMDPAAMAPQG